MIMDITAENVTVNRVSVNSGKAIKSPWVISAPYGEKSGFIYTPEQRIAADEAPCFLTNGNAGVFNEKDCDGNDISVIKFDAADDDDFVHSYRLEFLDGQRQRERRQ